MLASRKYFQDMVHCSMAVDASRVAKRKKLVGVIGTPDNIVMFTPPVVGALLGSCFSSLGGGVDRFSTEHVAGFFVD